MIWVETPSNPMLKLVDLEAWRTFAKRRDILAVATTLSRARICSGRSNSDSMRRALGHEVSERPLGHGRRRGGGGRSRNRGAAAFLQNAVGAVAGRSIRFSRCAA